MSTLINRIAPPTSPGLNACDSEPIQIPGSIQPHGALIALSPEDLAVVQVAGDSHAFIGVEPEKLLGQSLRAQLGGTAWARLDLLLSRSQVTPRPSFVFQVQVRELTIDVSAHVSGGLIVLEFEQRSSAQQPEPMELVRQMTSVIQSAATVETLLQDLASEVQRVTGFDRVMVYRFDQEGSGHVAAEKLRSAEVDSFLDLHYPAGDIPQQARALYTNNWIRSIPDVSYSALPITPLHNPLTGLPLDLTFSALRSVSPVHLEYLANMGVSASLSLSIVIGGRLWGLVACHHLSPRYLDCSLRCALELFAQLSSLQLANCLEAERTRKDAHRREVQDDLVATLAQVGFPEGLIRDADAVMKLIDATGLVVHADGETFCHGAVPDRRTIHGVIAWLNNPSPQRIWATDRLSEHVPCVARSMKMAAGLLAVSISREPRDYVLWFLPEVATTVTWAGDPRKDATPSGGRLTPRASFAAWLETVTGRSRPWLPDEIDAAIRLRVLLLEFALLRLDEVVRERDVMRERQDLLMAELDHRVKNILATIQALIRFSSKSAESLASFTLALEHRLVSMARAHDLLTSSRWTGASLQRLVAEELAAFCPQGDARLEIVGEDFSLTPVAALSVSLVLHELATNAAKYGCLSVPHGRLRVNTGKRVDENGLAWISLMWIEQHGPEVVQPTRNGFGRILLEKAFKSDASGGRVTLQFEPAGVRCRIELPVDRAIAANSREVPSAPARLPVHFDTLPHMKGIRVLVAESDPLVCLDVMEIIHAAGASIVGPFHTTKDSLTALASGNFDIALLDVELGDEGVWPLAHGVRTLGIPIVFSTSLSDSSERPEEFIGVTSIQKPYDAHRLLGKLHRTTFPHTYS